MAHLRNGELRRGRSMYLWERRRRIARRERSATGEQRRRSHRNG
jgi:hypothetical protein